MHRNRTIRLAIEHFDPHTLLGNDRELSRSELVPILIEQRLVDASHLTRKLLRQKRRWNELQQQQNQSNP